MMRHLHHNAARRVAVADYPRHVGHRIEQVVAAGQLLISHASRGIEHGIRNAVLVNSRRPLEGRSRVRYLDLLVQAMLGANDPILLAGKIARRTLTRHLSRTANPWSRRQCIADRRISLVPGHVGKGPHRCSGLPGNPIHLDFAASLQHQLGQQAQRVGAAQRNRLHACASLAADPWIRLECNDRCHTAADHVLLRITRRQPGRATGCVADPAAQ